MAITDEFSIKPFATGAALTIGGIGLGAAAGYLLGSRTRRSTTKRKSRKVKNSHRTMHKGKRRRYTPHTAGKRRDTSMRRIRMTSNGQPYVILANGRARFISKKSAKASRKRKGGRY